MHIGQAFKNSFIAGSILVAPLVVTLWVLNLLFRWLTGVIDPIVAATRLTNFTGDVHVVAQVLAVACILLTITVVGALAQWSVGKRVFGSAGRVVDFIPLVRIIYSSVRQVGNALMSGSDRFDRVVIVEYPRPHIYSIGFVTGEGPRTVGHLAEEPVYNVLLPHSPNPTVGKFAHVPESELHEVDMSVRRGIQLLVTSGLTDARDEAMAALEAAERLERQAPEADD